MERVARAVADVKPLEIGLLLVLPVFEFVAVSDALPLNDTHALIEAAAVFVDDAEGLRERGGEIETEEVALDDRVATTIDPVDETVKVCNADIVASLLPLRHELRVAEDEVLIDTVTEVVGVIVCNKTEVDGVVDSENIEDVVAADVFEGKGLEELVRER